MPERFSRRENNKTLNQLFIAFFPDLIDIPLFPPHHYLRHGTFTIEKYHLFKQKHVHNFLYRPTVHGRPRQHLQPPSVGCELKSGTNLIMM